MYPKFLIFKLSNVSNKDALSICKRLLLSAINKCNKELQHLSKELSLSENFLSTRLSTIYFYILTKSTTSYNKELLQKSLYTQQKKSYLHWRGIATCLYSQLTKLWLISRNMNYPRKSLTYLKQVYTFQSNQIKLKNPKSSLLLKRFIVRFLTTLNPRKPKVRIMRIFHILLILIFTTKKLLHVNILRQDRVLRNLRKNKDIDITKLDKGNGVVISDRKPEKIISDTSKFEKLNEEPTLKRESSLHRFLRKLK